MKEVKVKAHTRKRGGKNVFVKAHTMKTSCSKAKEGCGDELCYKKQQQKEEKEYAKMKKKYPNLDHKELMVKIWNSKK